MGGSEKMNRGSCIARYIIGYGICTKARWFQQYSKVQAFPVNQSLSVSLKRFDVQLPFDLDVVLPLPSPLLASLPFVVSSLNE